MLNRYPLWKYLMVIVVIAIGFLYAAPNLYGGEDPALQVSASRGAEVKLDTLGLVKGDARGGPDPGQACGVRTRLHPDPFQQHRRPAQGPRHRGQQAGDNFITPSTWRPPPGLASEAIGAAPQARWTFVAACTS